MTAQWVERVESEGEQLALIVRAGFHEPGVHFFTPDHLSQQLAHMRHPAGHVIEAHVHNPVRREVQYTQEVLILRRGRLRVDFYTPAGAYLLSSVLEAGDIILLTSGGHGFEVLEEIEMIEVKQGPFIGAVDKRHIPGIAAADVRVERSAG
ncbi:MAG: hypothetical protein HQL40_02330 [Alphaproteobacteria bacterium]|nr:hypothetical protein [Alphaproteobacteria bacterium]MBF0332468.1 hypothetical protein [Alphaproteobacteria bacterium]